MGVCPPKRSQDLALIIVLRNLVPRALRVYASWNIDEILV